MDNNKDIRSIKVSPECHALLAATARVSGVQLVDVVRMVLHDWSDRQRDIFTLADRLARVEGSDGIARDGKGR